MLFARHSYLFGALNILRVLPALRREWAQTDGKRISMENKQTGSRREGAVIAGRGDLIKSEGIGLRLAANLQRSSAE